jgi:hypothetical protein
MDLDKIDQDYALRISRLNLEWRPLVYEHSENVHQGKDSTESEAKKDAIAQKIEKLTADYRQNKKTPLEFSNTLFELERQLNAYRTDSKRGYDSEVGAQRIDTLRWKLNDFANKIPDQGSEWMGFVPQVKLDLQAHSKNIDGYLWYRITHWYSR